MGSNWRVLARGLLDWTRATFGTNYWARYGVTAIQEQTAYRVPGNSHSSRHASVELIYAEKTGDTTRRAESIRLLDWATCTVADDGRNRYPNDDIWLTDGYGDYVRHYLRAMAAAPELAPADQNHLLRSSSAIKAVTYAPDAVAFTTCDRDAVELLRLRFTPASVTAGRRSLPRLNSTAALNDGEGYTFEAAGDPKGVLRIHHRTSSSIRVAAR